MKVFCSRCGEPLEVFDFGPGGKGIHVNPCKECKYYICEDCNQYSDGYDEGYEAGVIDAEDD